VISSSLDITKTPARRVYDIVFSFEFLLVLFLFAGRLKANPRLAWIPIDLTAALLVASVVVAGFVLYQSSFSLPRRGLSLTVAAGLFVGWVLVSLNWTPSVNYARDKSLSLVVLAFWPLVACALIIAPSPTRVKKFIDSILIFGVAMSLDLVVLALRVGPSRVMLEVGSEYLGVGRIVGLAAPVLFLLASLQKNKISRLFLFGCFVSTLTAVILSGGRGPAVGMLASMAVPFLFVGLRGGRAGGLHRYIRMFAVMVVLVTAVVVLMVGSGLKPATIQRAEQTFTTDSGGHSTAERFRYYSEALDAWKTDPVIGRGVGSFPVLFGRADEAFYPHNIFLEILVENGMIGVLLFVVLIVTAMRLMGFKPGQTDVVRMILLMMFVNAFMNAQVTADLPDNRLLFALLGLMAFNPGPYGESL
jgi:O-antigen ligase